MAGILRILAKSYRQARKSGEKVLHGVLAQAREPIFYRGGGVQDTVTGRFDLIALHAFLVMRAMRHDPKTKDINQAFLESLFAALDASYREAGISDPGMPRKMKQTASALYGRLQAYEKGLGECGLAGLEDALMRNLYRNETPGEGTVEAMARYVIGSLGTLALMTDKDWCGGKLQFAAPDFGGAK